MLTGLANMRISHTEAPQQPVWGHCVQDSLTHPISFGPWLLRISQMKIGVICEVSVGYLWLLCWRRGWQLALCPKRTKQSESGPGLHSFLGDQTAHKAMVGSGEMTRTSFSSRDTKFYCEMSSLGPCVWTLVLQLVLQSPWTKSLQVEGSLQDRPLCLACLVSCSISASWTIKTWWVTVTPSLPPRTPLPSNHEPKEILPHVRHFCHVFYQTNEKGNWFAEICKVRPTCQEDPWPSPLDISIASTCCRNLLDLCVRLSYPQVSLWRAFS